MVVPQPNSGEALNCLLRIMTKLDFCVEYITHVVLEYGFRRGEIVGREVTNMAICWASFQHSLSPYLGED